MSYFQIIKNELVRIFTYLTGPKILIIDDNVKSIITSLFMHSDLLLYEIFGIVMIYKKSGIEDFEQSILSCVSYILILSDLTSDIYRHLMKPEFDSYYLYISKIIKMDELSYISNADKYG